MNARPIIFVGYRKEALQAAVSKDIPFILLDESKTSKYALACFKIPFEDSPEDIPTQVLQELQVLDPEAVIALTEKSVEVSGILRAALGLKGNSKQTAQLCHDKFKMKTLAREKQIPVTDFYLTDERSDWAAIAKNLGLPFVIKPRGSSGGRNFRLIHSLTEVQNLKSDQLLAERFVHGPELSIESFVLDKKILFQNITRYHQQWTLNQMPMELGKKDQDEILSLNAKILSTFSVQQGMTHVEVYQSPKGLVFGEIAIRPPGGYLMKLLSLSYGFNPWDALIDTELGREVKIPQTAKSSSVSWVIHPGEGQVTKAFDPKLLSKEIFVKEARMKVKEGEYIQLRSGSGADIGYVLFSGPESEALMKQVEICMNKYQVLIR